jgi:anti-anti-sigma factor
MTTAFTVQQVEKFTVVEFMVPSLLEPAQLQQVADDLYRLIDEQDRRRIVLDFQKVRFVSSQALGIVMAMRKKLAATQHSALVLCGLGPKLLELLKLTGLDRVLTIKPSQREAVKVFT